jgi:hypothetical protein
MVHAVPGLKIETWGTQSRAGFSRLRCEPPGLSQLSGTKVELEIPKRDGPPAGIRFHNPKIFYFNCVGKAEPNTEKQMECY